MESLVSKAGSYQDKVDEMVAEHQSRVAGLVKEHEARVASLIAGQKGVVLRQRFIMKGFLQVHKLLP